MSQQTVAKIEAEIKKLKIELHVERVALMRSAWRELDSGWIDAPGETWKTVPGLAGLDVSNFGRVRRWTPNGGDIAPKLVTPTRTTYGYYEVCVGTGGRPGRIPVHRAVLSAFDGLPGPEEVARHMNGLRTDNRLDNLVWGTTQDNADDRGRHGRTPFGESVNSATLSKSSVEAIINSVLDGEEVDQTILGADLGVRQTTISAIVRAKTWVRVWAEVVERRIGLGLPTSMSIRRPRRGARKSLVPVVVAEEVIMATISGKRNIAEIARRHGLSANNLTRISRRERCNWVWKKIEVENGKLVVPVIKEKS